MILSCVISIGMPKALSANGADVEGKHIRVDRAKSGEYDHARSVFLGNLPMDAREDEASDGKLSLIHI